MPPAKLSPVDSVQAPAPAARVDVLAHPLCLRVPGWLGQLTSEQAHVPLALLVADLVRPGAFVQLGGGDGVVYGALCEAVAQLRLQARGWAFGDLAPGFKQHHDAHFGSFSSLAVAPSAEAAGAVGARELDLLVVGTGGREAVNTVWSRLSSKAVVLVLGIEPGELNAHLWSELREQHPQFAVHHAGGCGVLAVGAHARDVLAGLTGGDDETQGALRELLFALGQRVTQRAALEQAQSGEASERARLERHLQTLQSLLKSEQDLLRTKDKQLKKLENAQRDLDAIKASLAMRLARGAWAIKDRVLATDSTQRRVYDAVKRQLRRR